MKVRILTLVICCAVIACKNDKESNEPQLIKKVEQKDPNQLIFEVDLSTSKPDEFKFFATDVFLNNNQFMNISVGQKLNMNETSKKMVFKFPEDIKPDVQLGFTLGTKFEKEIEIRKMTLSFGGTIFECSQESLHDYFTFNKFIEYDPSSKSIQTKKVDGKHNPTLFVRRKFLDSLQNVNQ